MARSKPYDRNVAVEAALNLFWDKGYYAATVKDIEHALSMKPGSIYAAFGSKEGLYLEAMMTYFERSRTDFLALVGKTSSPLEALTLNLQSLADLQNDDMRRRACMLAKSVIDTRSTDPSIADKALEHLELVKRDFAAVFAKAIAAGELPQDADPQFLAAKYQSNINALRFEMHQNADRDTVTALTEDMVADLTRRVATH